MADNFKQIRSGINLGSLPSEPANPVNGDIYYDETLGVVRIYQGGGFISAGPLANTPTAIIGQLILLPTSNVPAGVLEANGALVSRFTYAALFAQIGTTYGIGDGSTTFGLPDYRGVFIRGWNHGAGLDPDANARTEFPTLTNYTITGNTNGTDNTIQGLSSADYLNVAIGQLIQSDTSGAIPANTLVIGKTGGSTILLSANTTAASTGDTITLSSGASGDNVGSYQADQIGNHGHTTRISQSGPSGGYTSPGFMAESIATNSYGALNTDGYGGNQTNPRNNNAMVGIVYDSNLALGIQLAPFFAGPAVSGSANLTGGSGFQTFSNSPTLTFTPTISGTYRIYSNPVIWNETAGVEMYARIYNTAGAATLLYESQAEVYASSSLAISTPTIESIYTLTAGNTYSFDIQGNPTTGEIQLRGIAQFYIFGELVSTAITGGGGGGGSGINQLTGDVLAVGSGTVAATVAYVGGQSASSVAAGTVIANSLANASSGTSGSTKIGDDNSYSHFTPTAATVKGALAGIDAALGAAGSANANQTLSNLTAPTAINQDLLPASAGSNSLGSASLPWLNIVGEQIDIYDGSGNSVGALTNTSGSLQIASSLGALILLSAGGFDAQASSDVEFLSTGGDVIITSQTGEVDIYSSGGGNNINLNPNASAGGYINASESLISNLLDPVSAQDAVTLNYLTTNYYTLSALAAATSGSAGSTLIGDDNSYTNFSPATATVKGALTAIDTAIGSLESGIANAITSLIGDVSGVGPGATPTTVVSVGGQTAAAVAAAAAAIASSTTTGLPNAVVVTDGNGNIVAQNFIGNSSIINLPIGDTFTANTSYAVILGVNARSQTAGQIYQAQASNASTNLTFWCIGVAAIGATTTVGTIVPVTTQGIYTLQSADTLFTTSDIGLACYVNDGGDFTTTPPTSAGQAVYKIGIVVATNQIFIDGKQLIGIN